MSIGLKEKLAKLIFEYDELRFHICPKIENSYLLTFGFLEYEAYNLDIELEMIKHDETSEIEDSINMLEKYKKELDLAILQKEECFDLSDTDLDSLNSLYLDLIYKLHPLFNPIQSLYEKDLFEEIRDAFERYDLTSMRSLAILIPETNTIFEDDEFFRKEFVQINQKIHNIKNSYPYNKKEILEDEKLFKDYKIQLLDIIANNRLLIEQYRNLNIE